CWASSWSISSRIVPGEHSSAEAPPTVGRSGAGIRTVTGIRLSFWSRRSGDQACLAHRRLEAGDGRLDRVTLDARRDGVQRLEAVAGDVEDDPLAGVDAARAGQLGEDGGGDA